MGLLFLFYIALIYDKYVEMYVDSFHFDQIPIRHSETLFTVISKVTDVDETQLSIQLYIQYIYQTFLVESNTIVILLRHAWSKRC